MTIEYIKSDLCRYVGYENINYINFLKVYTLNTGFKYSVWLRLTRSSNPIVSTLAKLQRFRLSNKYMLQIPRTTEIGYGLYIGHGQNIVVSPYAKIGNNVNLSQFSTIGAVKGKAATIEDNVYLGPSICLVGDIKIGNNVKVGAGAVVTKSISKNSIAAGVPAKIISSDESGNDYVNNRWDF